MLKFVLPIVIAVAIIIASFVYLNLDFTLNKGEEDITYNGIVYDRADIDYNLVISEDNAKYIGDYGQIYAYGQEYLYEVRELNGDANILYTPHATFIKPGYTPPTPYGEDFSTVEYVVSEGLDFKGMPDDYTEEATLLASFDKSVKLEDIIESESSDITVSDEAIEECNEIRFKYKNHADIMLILDIYCLDGQYYLDVCHSIEGTDNWFKIKPEYLALLTSAIRNTK